MSREEADNAFLWDMLDDLVPVPPPEEPET
jgi:hypothetical protein